MKKTIFTIVRVVISISIIIWLFSQIGLENIIATFTSANVGFILLGFLAFFFSTAAPYLGIQSLVDGLRNNDKPRISRIKVMRSFALTYSTAALLPGRIGEFSLAFFLKKSGLTFGESSMVTLVDKFIASIVLLLLGASGLALLMGVEYSLRAVAILGPLALIGFALLFTKKGMKFIKWIIQEKFAEKFKGFSKGFDELKGRVYPLLGNVFFTMMRWIINAIAMYFVYKAFGANVSLIALLFIPPIINIIVLIPITVSGLGLRETSAVYLFSLVGVEPSVTISAYLIFTLVRYSFVGLFLLIFGTQAGPLLKQALFKKQQEA